MAVTIARLASMTELSLDLVAGVAGSGRDVRWVHVSELADPTPWLRGGELMLTTGMQLDGDDDCRKYIRRLSDAGIAGVGFGVGIGHERVPASLLEAADLLDMPLLRIPVDAPYISISEAVSNMIAAERYEAIARAFEAQQVLTRAALADSSKGLVHEIARQIRGWAIHTDSSGRLLTAWPESAAERLPSFVSDISRVREGGMRAAASIIGSSELTVIHSLSTGDLPRGFLVAGVEDEELGAFGRLVIQAGVALLTLESERSRAVSQRLRRLQSESFLQILKQAKLPSDAERQVRAWGLDPFGLRVLHVVGVEHATQARERFNRAIDEGVLRAVIAVVPAEPTSTLSLLVDEAQDLALIEAIFLETGGYLGVGDATTLEGVRRSWQGAQHAAVIGRIERRRTTRYEDLAAMQLLLGTEQPEALRAFVERVLGPLMRTELTERTLPLRATLEAFLRCNGHWNEAAGLLGVHRHTLRARITRIAELTGRDPELAYARMELWLAVLADGTLADVPLR